MVIKWSLRNRVAIAFALFGAVVSLSLAVTIYISSHNLESRLIDDTLTAELDDYITRRARNPNSLPEHTATISAYVVAEQGGTEPVPAEIRNLEPGFHNIVIDETNYIAAARDVGEQLFVVVYNTNALQQRETSYLILLLTSVLLITLISAFAGRWLSARSIAPVTELARRVSQLHPEDEPITLAAEFPWVEVQQLARDFDIYLKRLHDFIEREQLFTGDVSHELRTPIAVILGASELMRLDENLDEKNRDRALRVYRAASEMSEITSALLALAREQGDADSQSEKQPVVNIVNEVVKRHRQLCHKKEVSLLLDIEQSSDDYTADHAILSMVFGNLLRNALGVIDKGEVRVTINRAIVRIEDNGPGLGDKIPAELFSPYVRGSQSTGAGLGLSLVWRLCRLQGWSVSLDNRPDGGAVAELDVSNSSTNNAG